MGSAVPPSRGEIHVVPAPMEAPPAPKPGSARESMFADLRARAKGGEAPEATPKPAEARKSGNDPEHEEVEEGDEEGAEGAEVPKSLESDVEPESVPDPKEKPAESKSADPKVDAKGKKVNPWKLSEEWKGKATKAEAEVVELRKLIGNPEARKSEVETIAKERARLKELEDHIRFIDYSKSKEYVETYQKPYEDQWARSLSELSEIVVSDPDSGAERAMNAQDLLQLVNMPLNKARELATELYGASADDVMAHRRDIKRLYQAQSAALEKARKEGGEHLKQKAEQTKLQEQETQKFISEHWEKVNKSIVDDPKIGSFFKPIDGDKEANERLEKGYKFVDEAMVVNPADPALTPEQRAEAVKRHAAIRHRAAAFGRMRLTIERERKEKAELQKKLEAYESSTPEFGAAPRPAGGGPPVAQKASQVVFGALRKIAK